MTYKPHPEDSIPQAMAFFAGLAGAMILFAHWAHVAQENRRESERSR